MRQLAAMVILLAVVSPASAVRLVGSALSDGGGAVLFVLRVHPVGLSDLAGRYVCRPATALCLLPRGRLRAHADANGLVTGAVSSPRGTCLLAAVLVDGELEGRYACTTTAGDDSGSFLVRP